MYHIIIPTPLYQGSNFLPHLLEHSLLPKRENIQDYFQNEIFSGENYLYYTIFYVQSDDREVVENFKKSLQEIPSQKQIEYEKWVIEDESQNLSYTKKVINALWKKIFKEDYFYGKIHDISYNEIKKYHQKYYQNNTIFILEDCKITDAKTNEKVAIQNRYKLEIDGEIEIATVFGFSQYNLFIINLLGSLFDEYLQYAYRYKHWQYFANESIYGEFENLIFLVVPQEDYDLLQNIPDIFIEKFIEKKLQDFNDDNYTENDAISVMKFGTRFWKQAKQNLIKNLWKIYQQYQKESEKFK